MNTKPLADRVNIKIKELNEGMNDIIVLKEIPLEVIDPNAADLDVEKIVKNKIMYFISIMGRRRILAYEEFLLLSSFILEQCETVYILNNNIFMEQYPIYINYSEEIKKGLLNHFSDVDVPNDEKVELGNIEEYISLYNGVREYNGYLVGSYCDERISSNIKIIEKNLFDEVLDRHIPYVKETSDFYDLLEEADFVNLIKIMLEGNNKLAIRLTNYSGDRKKMLNHLLMFIQHWGDLVDIRQVPIQTFEEGFEHKEEYSEILKKYWGYDDFRELSIYDMSELENGKKKVVQISQEKIIADIVEQSEKCIAGQLDFRDVFVTAPTGAGKSVMFQIPAIYMAEKYDLLTIVISPLIGLMNDQVKNLEIKNYKAAKTINSDISPIIKEEITEKISGSEYHILYISPETLLSRSDIEQLIGNRTIGMIVIDEAHIVTTWGKQFRPDYWYLGDHIRKLRKKQWENKKQSFVVSTFTATAIYRGIEDMYSETVNSLHMLDPITYLGYVKRNDIDILIDKPQKGKGGNAEYEFDKFKEIKELLKRAIVTNKKVLVYFPTVALIDRCYDYLKAEKMVSKVAKYHGSLSKEEKAESYDQFYNKEKLLMLATKAFGMGIDINDIEIVMHFAPTGNVCDYVQEIGRAARRSDLEGEAIYHYDSRDFKHINRLHGVSMIQKYQLIEVVKKIESLYHNNLQKNRNDLTRKRRSMLLDAENFTYIFKSPVSDEDNAINKVKTALLILQKDFESKMGFSPINVRPIPMFAMGFFKIDERTQMRISRKYPDAIAEINSEMNICRLRLDKIWERDYSEYSFPKFKYMLYAKDTDLNFIKQYTVFPALCVSIDFKPDHISEFEKVWSSLKGYVSKKVVSGEHTAIYEIADYLHKECGIGKYKAYSICEIVVASMDSFRKKFAKTTAQIASEKVAKSGETKYRFNVAVNSYFRWVESGYRRIVKETVDGELYLINDGGNVTKEINVILGVLEAMNILSFEMIGGANSQLYIYVNQILNLKKIIDNPGSYRNNLLELVAQRHLISVEMLTYLYEGQFASEEAWDILEDYFLGQIPEKVKSVCHKKMPQITVD